MATLNADRLAFIFHQVAGMTAAGISLVQAWKLVANELEDKKVKKTMQHIAGDMEKGQPLSTAMEQSGLFPMFSCHVIKAGENAGTIDTMLVIVSDYYASCHKDKIKLINSLIYPAFLIICTLAMLSGVIICILPIFKDMFQTMSVPIPRPTQVLLSIHEWLRRHILLLISLGTGTVVGAAYIISDWKCRLYCERAIVSIACIRCLLVTFYWQRFSRILSIQLSGGIPLLTAMEDARKVISSPWFQQQIIRIKENIEQGIAFSEAVKLTPINTAYVEALLILSESTGNYEEALAAVSNYYQWRLTNKMARLTKLLEPLIVFFVGIAIGILVICLLLPLFDAVAAMSITA